MRAQLIDKSVNKTSQPCLLVQVPKSTVCKVDKDEAHLYNFTGSSCCRLFGSAISISTSSGG